MERALPFYVDVLKLKLLGIEEIVVQKVKVAFLAIGDSKLELLEPLSSESSIARFIQKNGEGIHHIALGTTSLEERIRHMKECGIQMINEIPQRGAKGTSIAFIHPSSSYGTLYELCDKGENMIDIYGKITELYDKKNSIEIGGGYERVERQYQKGKLTARERIELLLDKDTFVELQPFIEHRCTDFGLDKKVGPGDGVVTGYGKVNGRPIYLFSQDFTVFGGALGEMHAKKISNIMDLAGKNGIPIVGLNDSGGARIQEGVLSLDGYGQIFHRNVKYSGVIPQISVILGACAGGAVYSPAITDFVIMVEEKSQMFITGPKVIEAVTGEKISPENLGGAMVHNQISGNAHFSAVDEYEALYLVRTLLSYLPQNYQEKSPIIKEESVEDYREDLADIIPDDTQRPYDIRHVIEQVVDIMSFFEVQKSFAKNIVIGFARIKGEVVGLVCNQPKKLAGSLDIDSSDKIARFIRFCDSFQIPLITFEDVTGFFSGCKART